MTLAKIRERARFWSRVNSTWTSGDGIMNNGHLNDLIQEAIDEFAIDVHGFALEEYLAIEAKFTTRTHMGINIVSTDSSGTELMNADVAITATDRDEASGTTIAADLQIQIRAATGATGTETVVWAAFAFTIDLKQGATFEMNAPDGVTLSDSRERLGLEGFTSSGTILTSVFPQDCTLHATLPTDQLVMEYAECDGHEIEEISREWVMSPEANGTTVRGYHIRGREIYLSPSPSRQTELHVWYKGNPTELNFAGYQEAGLSDISDESNTGIAAQGWKYKVAINGADADEFDIITTATDTYAALIILMNAQNTGATWSLVGGDLRCTSDAVDGVSTIAVTAGSSVDLLAALSITMETAVAGDTALPAAIPEAYHLAIPRLIASKLREELNDTKGSALHYSHYFNSMQKYLNHRNNMGTEPDENRGGRIRKPRVIMPS